MLTFEKVPASLVKSLTCKVFASIFNVSCWVPLETTRMFWANIWLIPRQMHTMVNNTFFIFFWIKFVIYFVISFVF